MKKIITYDVLQTSRCKTYVYCLLFAQCIDPNKQVVLLYRPVRDAARGVGQAVRQLPHARWSLPLLRVQRLHHGLPSYSVPVSSCPWAKE